MTVLLSDLTDRRRAAETADRIRTAFDRPFTVGLHEVFTSVSIGIAFTDADGSAQDILRQRSTCQAHICSRRR